MPMSIRSRTRHARRAFAGPAAPLTRKTPRRLPAAVEALEHRLVFSTFTVTTLAHTAAPNRGVPSPPEANPPAGVRDDPGPPPPLNFPPGLARTNDPPPPLPQLSPPPNSRGD